MESHDHATLADRLAAAVAAISSRWTCEAKTAVVLGTGLGHLADEAKIECVIPYREIPGFPHSTALAHKGRLVCGRLTGTPVVLMQGRCHLYEGRRLDELALPIRVLCELGIETLVVTNAAGGLNPDFVRGDVMLIDDHINLMGFGSHWPMVLGRDTRRAGGVRLPVSLPVPSTDDVTGVLTHPARQARAYDRHLAATAVRIARRNDFTLQRGVYVGVTGPCYETRAEYRAFRRIGGDCVGMSTVPEVLTARACGMRVLGISTVTNVACPDAPKTVSADEVVEVAATALPKVRAIVQGLLRSEL
jgi:purine-nucleoside phosphorylase